jgi:hypothetical protein
VYYVTDDSGQSFALKQLLVSTREQMDSVKNEISIMVLRITISICDIN